MNSIITTHILPNMSVEVTTNHHQIIFTNFGDKKDQIFRLYPLHLQLSLIVVHVDKIVRIDQPISSFNIIKLSFTRFTSEVLSIYFLGTSIPTSPTPKLFLMQNILYSLSFLIVSLVDVPLHLISCTQHINFPSWSQQHSNFLICTSVLYLWFLIAG